MQLFWGLLLLSVCLTLPLRAAPPIRTVIGENMSAPWYIAHPQEPQGITAEYLRALAKELNRDFEILVLPKFRIQEYFQKGKVDLNCYTSREWAHVKDEDVYWSEPLFISKNLIVSNTSPAKSLQQLRGHRIGTVLKYSYPAMQEGFTAGTFKRDDSANEEANLQKLESSRFSYALAESVHLDYYLKHHKNSKIQRQGLLVEEAPVRCWVRRGAPLKISDLNRAIEKIKSNGTLDGIFKKYK